MNHDQLVAFVRARGLGVVSTLGPDGAPQSALVGVAMTDEGELVFDTSRDADFRPESFGSTETRFDAGV